MKKKGTKEERMRMRSKCNCDELKYVECVLETKDLWDKFHDLETEMIITKTGRYRIHCTTVVLKIGIYIYTTQQLNMRLRYMG